MKAPWQLHAAAATLLLAALRYLLVVIHSVEKSRYVIGGYRGVALLAAMAVLLYVFPKILRWVAAAWFAFSALAMLSTASHVLPTGVSLAAILTLLVSGWAIFLVHQLTLGRAIKAYVSPKKNQGAA